MAESYKLSEKEGIVTDFASSFAHLDAKQAIDALQRIIELLKKKHGSSNQQIIAAIVKQDVSALPISIFNNNLSPLEAIVQFLKDDRQLILHKIAQILKRDDRTIWTTYTNAKKKAVELDISGDLLVPISLFSQRYLSILENLVVYLKEKLELSNIVIAKLIGRNNKTIWTVYNRALKKLA